MAVAGKQGKVVLSDNKVVGIKNIYHRQQKYRAE